VSINGLGDEDGNFEVWYRREQPRLVTVLAASTRDVALATEATDEAFARAFERWRRVSQMDSPTGWTYRVALNIVRRRTRRHALERLALGRMRSDDVPGPTGELWLMVADLPPRQRTAVLLRHVGQLTEQEVADVTGVARGTVSSTLRSAYQRLRNRLMRAGYDVAPDGTTPGSLLGAVAHLLCADGIQVRVYQYADVAARVAVSGASAPTAPRSNSVHGLVDQGDAR
jgi:DNA-directed RNA polymerase specialized sigma24 family protein